MLTMNIWIFFYCVVNLIGALVFFIGTTDGLNWEELFNPNSIYQCRKVNRFGAYFLATISFLCMTPFALIFYIAYRKDKKNVYLRIAIAPASGRKERCAIHFII